MLAAFLTVVSLALFLLGDRVSRCLSPFIAGCKDLVRLIPTHVHAAWVEDRTYVLIFLSISLWGGIIRGVYLTGPIRFDEGYTFLRYASKPIFVGASYYTANNHFLNTVLMHFSTSVCGGEPWAIRLPAFLAGIMIPPLAGLALHSYRERYTGLLTVALVSASFPLVEYSVNARGYALGTLFLLFMILLIRFAKLSPVTLAIAGVSAGLSLYSVPSMIYGVCGVFFWAAFRLRSIRLVAVMAIPAAFVSGLLYLPVFATVGLSTITTSPWLQRLPWNQLVSEIPFALTSLWEYWTMRLPDGVEFLLASAVVGGVVHGVLRRSLQLVVVVPIAAIAILAIQHVDPPRRTWLFLLPIFLGTAAEGVSLLLQELPRSSIAIPAVAISLAVLMGSEILRGGPLYRPGGSEKMFHNAESFGFPEAPAFASDFRNQIQNGCQLKADIPYSIPIEFEIFRQRLTYNPSPSGDTLLVTCRGCQPNLPLVGSEWMRLKTNYRYADVFLAHTASLPDALR